MVGYSRAPGRTCLGRFRSVKRWPRDPHWLQSQKNCCESGLGRYSTLIAPFDEFGERHGHNRLDFLG
jgi:hypothetical protein